MKRLTVIVTLLFFVLVPVLTMRAQGRAEILRADWGSGYHSVDVTQRVRSLFRNPNLDLIVSPYALGSDPAPGAWKTLRLIVREANGRIRRLEYPEGYTVTLRGYNYGGNYTNLRILGAQYGAENRWIDVTDRLSALARNGQVRVQVTNQTMGGDPARGLTKALTVWYVVNGQSRQAVVNENGFLDLPGDAGYTRDNRGYPGPGGYPGDRGYPDNRDGRNGGTLQITRAQYGAGNRVMDVTDRLNGQLRGGQLNLQVSNQNMGGDPAQGQTKALTVWYTFNGRPGQVVVNENGSLNLPGDIAGGTYQDNRGGGYGNSDVQAIRCESINNQRQYCSADTRGGVQLVQQVSSSACVQGSSWGYDVNGVWVDRGCRADFEVRGGNRRF